MSFASDKDVFLSDFGAAAVIGGSSVSVIFDHAYLASLDIETSNPVALAKSADVANVNRGDAVAIAAGDFNDAFNGKVVGIQPDGTGFSLLELQKV